MFLLPDDGDSAVRPFRHLLTRLAVPLVLTPLVAGGCVWMTGARNPYTPAGYVGYLTRAAKLRR